MLIESDQTFRTHDLLALMGFHLNATLPPRFRCRLYLELLRNHFSFYINTEHDEIEWMYIGSYSIAEALASAKDRLPSLGDCKDDGEWKLMEGK